MQTTTLTVEGLDLQIDLDQSIWFLVCKGVLDARTADAVAEVVESIFLTGGARLCFDLRELTTLSSAGIGVLLTAHARARIGQGRVVLIPPTQRLMQQLVGLGVPDVVAHCRDRDVARRALYPGPHTNRCGGKAKRADAPRFVSGTG